MGEEGAPGAGVAGAGVVLPPLAGTQGLVAEAGSQLQVGEAAGGQQNPDEVGKTEVKVVVGFLQTRIPQAVVGAGWPLGAEVEELEVEQIPVWGLLGCPGEELGVGGQG